MLMLQAFHFQILRDTIPKTMRLALCFCQDVKGFQTAIGLQPKLDTSQTEKH